MEWEDDAIVLAGRRHGESAVILEALTRQHGRHMGLVHGGATQRRKAALSPGNSLRVVWRARLSDHLGAYTIELARERAGALLEQNEALTGLNAFAEIARAVLPEREPHETVYRAAEILLDAITSDDFLHWGPVYVRWELGVLDALGFGLDLSRCVVTGTRENLCYVSPKSGRAVSADAGARWREKLFALPDFLRDFRDETAARAEIAAGLRLTGYFLLDRVLHGHHRPMPAARERLDAFAARESA